MTASFPLPNIDVDRRFKDAMRAGSPDWLWFELPEARWAEATETIEAVLREMLTFGRSDDKLFDDPIALSIACYTSGTGPLLGSWIEQGKLTTTAQNAEILRIHLDHNRMRMARLTTWASEAVDALSAVGAIPIVMKGMHTAHHYFDEPGQRVASDIDLLVRPDELPIVAGVLTELNYEPRKGSFLQRSWARPATAETPVTLTYVHRDDPWSIDLHEGVVCKLAGGSLVADISALLPTIALDSWHLSRGGVVFPPPLLLIHLLIHASRCFVSLTLQRQYEICLVIRRNDGREAFDWPAFAELCDLGGFWPFLYPALRCAERLSPNIIPPPIMTRACAATPPMVRKLADAHSSASIHRIGRWSWGERFMWADGTWPRLRQFLEELAPPEHLNFREAWRKRFSVLLGSVAARAKGARPTAETGDKTQPMG